MRLPDEPIETEPIEVYRGEPFEDVRALLDEAVAGMELGAYDRRMIEWLKGWDQPTIVTLASVIQRARREGTWASEA